MTLTINDYFFLEPDWSSPVVSKRIWRTSFQTTIKEQEKRSALFTYPRRGMQLYFQSLSTSESNYVMRKLYKNMHKVWGFPFWAEGTALSSQASSGQATLNVGSTSYRNFEVGGVCVIFDTKENYEAGTISSIGASSITLDANLVGTWGINTFVYPVLKCRIGVQQSVSKLNSREMSLSLEVKEDIDPDIIHELLTISTFPEYQGFSVFNLEPDWSGPLNIDFTHNNEVFQFLGISCPFSNVAETNLKLLMKYITKDKSELNEYLAFFDDCKGRWQSFWLPSFNSDVVITSAFSSAETTFDIEDIKWSDYWNGMDVVGQYLRFLFPDGSEEYRQILSSPTDTSLTIDSAIGTAITEDELSLITVSFLFFVRFDIDEFSVTRMTDEISSFELKFSTIYGATI